MSTVTPLPPAPSRGDDAENFADKADTFVAALPTLVTEINTVSGEVNTNAANAAADAITATNGALSAAGAANYKGVWASLTGPLSIPSSVAHGGHVWNLNVNLADVTASIPNDSNSDWTNLTNYNDNFYSALLDYIVGERVTGTDYKIYRALVANGPSSSVVDPVGDTTGVWVDPFSDDYSPYIDYTIGEKKKGSDSNWYKALVANGPSTSVVDPVGDTTGVWGNNWGVFHVQDQKTSGTSGGASSTGARVTRVLNTDIINTIAGASRSSNQIILPTGRYYIKLWTTGYSCDEFRAWFYNVTDGADIPLYSSTDRIGSAVTANGRTELEGIITIAAQKTFEIQFIAGAVNANGLGRASSHGIEVYSNLYIEKKDG